MTDDERDRMIQELWDRSELYQLGVRYCHYAHTHNVDGIVAMYSDKGEFNVPEIMMDGGLRSSKDAMRETLAAGFRDMDPWPFAHNHVVDLHGPDRASGVMYHEIRVGAEAYAMRFLVVYEDDYVKENGTWKFMARKITSTRAPD